MDKTIIFGPKAKSTLELLKQVEESTNEHYKLNPFADDKVIKANTNDLLADIALSLSIIADKLTENDRIPVMKGEVIHGNNK